ncbi:hypothetical protein EI94DRAFT_1749396 [Lactarius quietus]|nr:hypothetical protein EI94DRAFT_1749396 [Lactarius quietus]
MTTWIVHLLPLASIHTAALHATSNEDKSTRSTVTFFYSTSAYAFVPPASSDLSSFAYSVQSLPAHVPMMIQGHSHRKNAR